MGTPADPLALAPTSFKASVRNDISLCCGTFALLRSTGQGIEKSLHI